MQSEKNPPNGTQTHLSEHTSPKTSWKKRLINGSGWIAAGVLSVGVLFNTVAGTQDNNTTDIQISVGSDSNVCQMYDGATRPTYTRYIASLDTEAIIQTIQNASGMELQLLNNNYKNFPDAGERDERKIYEAAYKRLENILSITDEIPVSTLSLEVYPLMNIALNTVDSISSVQALEHTKEILDLLSNNSIDYPYMDVLQSHALAGYAHHHENVALTYPDELIGDGVNTSLIRYAFAPHDSTRHIAVQFFKETLERDQYSITGLQINALQELAHIERKHPHSVENFEQLLASASQNANTFIANTALSIQHNINERARLSEANGIHCANDVKNINIKINP